jgi:serine/threonine protein kinase
MSWTHYDRASRLDSTIKSFYDAVSAVLFDDNNIPYILQYGGYDVTTLTQQSTIYLLELNSLSWVNVISGGNTMARSKSGYTLALNHGTIADKNNTGNLYIFGGASDVTDGNRFIELDLLHLFSLFTVYINPVITTNAPSNRQHTAMVYLNTPHKIVIHGGYSNGASLNDMYQLNWNPSSPDFKKWTQINWKESPRSVGHKFVALKNNCAVLVLAEESIPIWLFNFNTSIAIPFSNPNTVSGLNRTLFGIGVYNENILIYGGVSAYNPDSVDSKIFRPGKTSIEPNLILIKFSEATSVPKGATNLTIIIVSVSAIGAILIIVIVVRFLYTRKRSKLMNHNFSGSGNGSLDHFDEKSTSGYSEDRKLELPGNMSLLVNVDYVEDVIMGRGGGGIIYKGTLLQQEASNRYGTRECAIKKAYGKNGDETEAPNYLEENLSPEMELQKKQFEQEIAFMWYFEQHRNFPRLFGYNFRCATIVMRFYVFGSLRDFIRGNSSKVGNHILLNILRDVITGLRDMHLNDIVHNDIKPANILLDKNQHGHPQAILSDFGNARVLEGTKISKIQNYKCVNVFSVSVHYSSPEAISRSLEKDAGLETSGDILRASDVYCYGGVIYECLAGKCPWSQLGSQINEIVQEVRCGRRPVLPATVGIRIREDKIFGRVVNAMQACYEHNPQRRPSASDILQYLLSPSSTNSKIKEGEWTKIVGALKSSENLTGSKSEIPESKTEDSGRVTNTTGKSDTIGNTNTGSSFKGNAYSDINTNTTSSFIPMNIRKKN